MKYDRTYNFSAGPAMMPESVLEDNACTLRLAQEHGVDYHLIDETYDVDWKWE